MLQATKYTATPGCGCNLAACHACDTAHQGGVSGALGVTPMWPWQLKEDEKAGFHHAAELHRAATGQELSSS